MKNSLFSIKGLLFFICLLMIAVASVSAKPSETLRKIKRIEVLKSTRGEVEKLFDNPRVLETRDLAVEFKNGWGKEIKYETKYGMVEVAYADGKCSERNAPYSYDIAADVVFGIRFYPDEIILENQLGYDLNKFKNDSASETDKTYSLETGKFKITIEVESFQVSSIEFEVSESHKKQLECKNFKVKEPVWFEKLRTLELFKSTRGEVEALFDNPRISEIEDWDEDGDNWEIDVEYETSYGELQVSYSTGKCSERQSRNGFDAARDTLVELKFIPAEKADATELNFDLRKFESDLSHGMIIKSNPQLSLRIFYYDVSKIESVEISPNDKQEEELDCEKVLNLQN